MGINISTYDGSTIATRSENISNIIDKLVRLTAKLTERFASDIIYDIDALNNAIKGNETFDRLLFFRECGVTAWATADFDESAYSAILTNFVPIQIWRLTHSPDTMETKLERVHIYKERPLLREVRK